MLQLTTQKLLERRLQTKVFKQGLAKSIHHARVLIKQRHIRVGKQLVNVPSFLVRVDSEKHIQFGESKSPHGLRRRTPFPFPRPVHCLASPHPPRLPAPLPETRAPTATTSPYSDVGRQGRVARKRAAAKAAGDEGEEDDE